MISKGFKLIFIESFIGFVGFVSLTCPVLMGYMLRLGDLVPDFQFRSTHHIDQPVSFHEWVGDSWAILFSHPADFTPVCTTELGEVAKLQNEFDQRNVKVIGLSTDNVSEHLAWISDIEETQCCHVQFPIIDDSSVEISRLYGMLDQESHDPSNKDALTGIPLTVRTVFIIDPRKKLRLHMAYPASVGRNFDEILRVVDALQLGDRHPIATPANWRVGDEVIVRFDLSDEEASKQFPQGFRTVKPYLRYTKVD